MADTPELDPERLELSAFEVPPPPADLADRVLARLPPRQPRPRWPLRAAAAVLLVALGGGGLWLARAPRLSGERAFSRRETVSLGASALAVAEAGTRLHWTGQGRSVRVRQSTGRVFYRVEPGADVQVETPAGQVAVRGTCFTLEVHEMLPSKQSLSGAAVGAVLTAAVFVTVHEGRVTATAPAGATEVGPGERVVMSGGAAPRHLVPATAPVSSASSGAPESEPPENWQAREAVYTAELAALRARVKELEAPAAAATPAPAVPRVARFVDPSREELLELARRCKVRSDEPVLRQQPPSPLTPEQLTRRGMSAEEAEVVAEVYVAFVAEAMERLRSIYVAATGDEEGARSLSPESLRQEARDKLPQEAVDEVYRRIAQERAGLATPPASEVGMTPAERLVRFNTGLGDAYERALAEKLGAPRAHELRKKNGGWDYKREVGSGHCPDSR